MGFPWKAVVTGGLILLKRAKPTIGAIVGALIHSAEKELPGPGRGLEKAEHFTDEFIKTMREDGIDVAGETEFLDKIARLRDLQVEVENLYQRLKAELKK